MTLLPSVIVVMGVSGAGKTTVAALLASRLGWEFEDADAFHPPGNIEKMKAGRPLDDGDRRPWLEAMARWIDEVRLSGRRATLACSALKRSYRRILIGDRLDVRLVYLRGSQEAIADRIRARQGHFMPPGLLRSQFEALEEPGPEERPVVISVDPPPSVIVEEILAHFEGGERH